MNIYKYIVGLGLCISFHAFAWDQKIENKTDGEILAKIKLLAAFFGMVYQNITMIIRNNNNTLILE
ncbi:MAG TPA: hypothetical protein VGW78_03725 [Candidatus Babeliales bacterium]|jgi:hypothetical protein|nr:hypothetical protein [Candidatus Babeliales bacterium]